VQSLFDHHQPGFHYRAASSREPIRRQPLLKRDRLAVVEFNPLHAASPARWLGLLASHGQVVDPWLAPLQRVRGKVEFDGLERVSSQSLLDGLEVPQRSRTAGTYRRLAKLMAELGWTAVRVRDLTRGAYSEQVRGYVRDRRHDILLAPR
jgi:hypothetical protein